MHPHRPLWQAWLVTLDSDRDEALNCDECFSILEYLAELGAAGVDADAVRQAAREHLARCPDCRAHHRQRLKELEARLG